MPKSQGRGLARRNSLLAGILAVVIAAGGVWYALFGGGVAAKPDGRPQAPAVPVTVATVTRQDVPLLMEGIGTVQPLNIVTIRSRVDGELQKVMFTEGQEVKAGDPLAQIDPRPFKAALDQAVAKKAQDEAQLANAQRDLERYEALARKDFSSRQQSDTQKAQVAQFQAMVQADQASIDSAQVQLDYASIRSPIDGRTGFRLVDQGNIVHAGDAAGIVVVTQTHPVSVVFTLPESEVHDVAEAMARGALTVLVNSRENGKHLADGVLKLIDNQIDETTGTIRLKAEFANTDDKLWPGEFVTARLLLRTDEKALTVPSNAVQRGANGLYVYVVKPDNTAELRPVEAARLEQALAVIASGVEEGERVVVSGHLKIQPGAAVTAKMADPGGKVAGGPAT
ncbi:MAG TPA: efflux RND transporter periplasmic adaptor subunit [Skermanella sp.]|nr:efflux RND transporter periplasmic adaptor subunit [Skermanella sp.]